MPGQDWLSMPWYEGASGGSSYWQTPQYTPQFGVGTNWGGRVEPPSPWTTLNQTVTGQPLGAYGGASGGGQWGGTGGGYDQYNDYILKAANQYGIDPRYIKAVMSVESGGNAKAVSSAGAQGLMQIMPGIWAKNGENLFDPATNIAMGTKILKMYLDKSGGDWSQALARYNGTWGKAAGQSYAQKVLGNLNKFTSQGGGAGASSGQIGGAINAAKSLVGYDSYVMGTTINPNDPRPKTTDCSSLVQWAYGRQGVKLPRTAFLQYNATQRISRDQLQPGDLVFFKNTYDATGQKGNTQNISHVGIYIGNGQMVNSTGSQGKGTVVQSIDTDFWKEHYAGAGRIAGASGGYSQGGGQATPMASLANPFPMLSNYYNSLNSRPSVLNFLGGFF